MTIRYATLDDLDQITHLYFQNHIITYKGLLPDEYISNLSLDNCRLKWSQFLCDPESRIWVALDEKMFLGFIAGRPDPELARTWYLDSLHVSEESRGKGVGSALIRTAGSYAAENLYENMSICIVRGNDRAGNLYQNLGAVHYKYFEDSFMGSPSRSEKLLWEDITHWNKTFDSL